MNLVEYKQQLESKNFPVFYDFEHVKKTFRIKDGMNKFMQMNTSCYRVKKHTKVKKGNGPLKPDYRMIYTVSPELKFIQKWIFDNILSKTSVSEASHAFVKGRSLLTNARAHVSHKETWLLRLDIRNFFESIQDTAIENIFIELGYSKGASKALTLLTTYKGRLRQGFLTSPSLSNLYLKNFDSIILSKINAEITYTRYADDLFFSGELTDGFEHYIAKIKQYSGYYLSQKHLRLKKSKTSLQTSNRKRITGLYIEGERIVVSKTYIKTIERELFYCEKYGISTHLRHSGKLDKMDFYKYILGKCAFVRMVEPTKGLELIEQVQKLYETNGVD